MLRYRPESSCQPGTYLHRDQPDAGGHWLGRAAGSVAALSEFSVVLVSKDRCSAGPKSTTARAPAGAGHGAQSSSGCRSRSGACQVRRARRSCPWPQPRPDERRCRRTRPHRQGVDRRRQGAPLRAVGSGCGLHPRAHAVQPVTAFGTSIRHGGASPSRRSSQCWKSGASASSTPLIAPSLLNSDWRQGAFRKVL